MRNLTSRARIATRPSLAKARERAHVAVLAEAWGAERPEARTRLDRAVSLANPDHITQVGDGYRVVGSSGHMYMVTREGGCSCPDHRFGPPGHTCKHALALALYLARQPRPLGVAFAALAEAHPQASASMSLDGATFDAAALTLEVKDNNDGTVGVSDAGTAWRAWGADGEPLHDAAFMRLVACVPSVCIDGEALVVDCAPQDAALAAEKLATVLDGVASLRAAGGAR